MVVLFMLPDIMVFRGYLPDINTPPSQSIPAGRWTSSHPVQQEQNPDSNQTDNPRFDHITIQDGLSTSTIRSIIQDQNGFLWIGTSAGFNKYDGYEISVHGTNPDEPATLNREVTSLYADSQGNLWIGTQSGLDRLNLASGEITQFRYVPNEIQPSPQTRSTPSWRTALAQSGWGRMPVSAASTLSPKLLLASCRTTSSPICMKIRTD